MVGLAAAGAEGEAGRVWEVAEDWVVGSFF